MILQILLIIFGTILLVWAIIYSVFVSCVPFSEGYRSGTLIQFKRKGILMRTWEGRIRPGSKGTTVHRFSVRRNQKEVIEKLKEYQGQHVRITYIEYYGVLLWRGSTQYFVTHVELEELDYDLREE